MKIPKDLKKLSRIFKEYGKKLYVVGGPVRDYLMGFSSKDYDLATDSLPDETEEILRANGFSCETDEKTRGILKTKININEKKEIIKISTFRKDSRTSNEKNSEKIEFADIYSDAKRRDFTINSLFYDIDKEKIVDLFGGINDIKNKIIRVIGNASKRLNEDKIKKLRALRFASRFSLSLSSEIDSYLRENNDLNGLPSEIIREEFIKGLKTAKKAKEYVKLLKKYDLFDYIFPGLKIDYENLEKYENQDYRTIIADLLKKNDLFYIKDSLNRLKYDKSENEIICFLASLKKTQNSHELEIDQNKIKNLKPLIVEFLNLNDRLKKFFKYETTAKMNDAFKINKKRKETNNKIEKTKKKEKLESLREIKRLVKKILRNDILNNPFLKFNQKTSYL